MSRRTFALSAAAAPLLAGVAGAQSAARSERSNAGAAAVAAKLQSASPTPALSLAVARPTGVVWAAAFGKANLESDLDTTSDHRFRLGSVSKTVTAVAAAELVPRGQSTHDRALLWSQNPVMRPKISGVEPMDAAVKVREHCPDAATRRT